MPTGYLFATLISLAVAQQSDSFDPQISKSELRSDTTSFRRVEFHSPWRPIQRVGHHKIVVDGDTVTIQQPDKQGVAVRSSHKLPLRWIASDDDVAYFVNEVREADADQGDFFVSPIVLRFSVTSNRWLDPLVLGSHEAEEKPETRTILGGILPSPSGLLVLSYSVREQADEVLKKWKVYRTQHYNVSLFPSRSRDAKWSKRFTWRGDSGWFPYPALVAKGNWSVEEKQIRTLNLIPTGNAGGDLVVVCAGVSEDILCLYAGDGSEAWRIGRIWEFQRGFIGPSVWEHYMTRFGLDEFVHADAEESQNTDDPKQKLRTEKARATIASSKERFYKLHNPSIAAGPVVVPNRGHHIFVAVANDPNDNELGNLARTLADSIVYEIDEEGELLAMTKLPRLVVGAPSNASPGALVWACDRGCLVRLGTSVPDFTRGFTNSGDDMLCRVEWYREIPLRIPKAWFVADPEHGIAAFSDTRMFRTGCSYVRTAEEGIYGFQISVVELDTGLDETLTLEVPFVGAFTMPEHGKSSFPGWTHAHGPHLLRIAELQAVGGRLRVVFEKEGNSKTAVEFDVSSLDAPVKTRLGGGNAEQGE